MSEKRTLANIAKTAYWDTESENKDTFDRVAKAVEREVLKRRVAPKKVNDPDDPTTWEKGVDIFARDSEYEHWVLDSFVEYDVGGCGFIFRCEDCGWKYAKLATPKQVEAWKLINDEFLD